MLSNVLFNLRQGETEKHTRQSYEELYRCWYEASAVLNCQVKLATTPKLRKRQTTRRGKSA